MSVLFGILLTLVVVVVVVVGLIGINAAILRLAVKIVGEDIGWGLSVAVVVVAGLVQYLCMGIFFGADLGVVGSLIGGCVWSGMLALMSGLSFGQSVLIGLAMTVLQWLIGWVLVIVGVATLVGGALGLAVAG